MKHHSLSLIILSAALLQAAQAYAGNDIDYVLTTQNDPVKPGHVLEFEATVRNLSGSPQTVRLDFTVPEFTTYNGSPPGTPHFVIVGPLPSGDSHTFQLLFNVDGGNTAPPDGTTIGLNLIDTARAGSVSRGVVARTMPLLNLQLSTEQGTVAPGGDFTYALTCANISATARTGVMLSASVPAGASFVSADGGGQLIDGVVKWTLGTLAAGADTQLRVTFRAGAPDTPLGPVNATLSDDSGDVARASDWRAVYATPQIEYTVTTPNPVVVPGHVAEFDVTVHNLSGSPQTVRLDFTVPEFTTYNGSPPGTPHFVIVGPLPSGDSHTFQLLFNVDGGDVAPPAGTIITLNLIDTARAGSVSLTIQVSGVTQPQTDFNGDSYPDFLLYNGGSHQTAIVYLNNNVVIGAALGATLPAGWTVANVADFNRDGHPDYVLFIPATHQTVIAYLSGPTVIGAALAPTLPTDWQLVAATDFNGDGYPDYVLYNTRTHQTAVWYLNDNVFVSSANGLTLPASWSLVAAADFNGDGNPDYTLFNSVTRQTVIVYLSGVTVTGAAFGPTVSPGYTLTGSADFNRDGNSDYLLFNPSTRRTAIWYLDNNVFLSSANGPTLPSGWSLAAP